MEEEIDVGSGTEPGERFAAAIERLEERRGKLADGRDALAVKYQELAPLEAYLAAKKGEYDGRGRELDAEEKDILSSAKGLRREIAAARRELEADYKQGLKDAAAAHKATLADLDRVSGELEEFGQGDT